MSSFPFNKFCCEPRKHNNILLNSTEFILDCIQDVTLDFSIPFFNESNVASHEYKTLPSLSILPATVKTNGVKLP